MRDYAKVLPRFWTSGTGKLLRDDPDAQRVAAYLMTCPQGHMTGLFNLAMPTLIHEVGSLSPEGACKALARLSQEAFAFYDPEEELFFLKEGARVQIGDTLHPRDKRIKGIAKYLQKYKNHEFYRLFLDEYAVVFHLEWLLEPKPLGRGFQAPPKPVAVAVAETDLVVVVGEDPGGVRSSNGSSLRPDQIGERTTTTTGVLRTCSKPEKSRATIDGGDVERLFAVAAEESKWPLHAHAQDYQWIASQCNAVQEPLELCARICAQWWKKGGFADRHRDKVRPRSLVKGWKTEVATLVGAAHGDSEVSREFEAAKQALLEAQGRKASEQELQPLRERVHSAVQRGLSNGSATRSARR
jgi:hypothetical protein